MNKTTTQTQKYEEVKAKYEAGLISQKEANEWVQHFNKTRSSNTFPWFK